MTTNEPVPFKYVPYDLVKQHDVVEDGVTRSTTSEKDRDNIDNGTNEEDIFV